MLAPRRAPPWLTILQAVSYTFMNPTGPVAWPPLDCTTLPLGRSLEKEKPVPPPVCWIKAMSRRVWKMPSDSRPISSEIGSTKQAASCPSGVPAPVKVGELGRKRRLEMRSKKRSSASPTSPPHSASAAAMW